MTKPVTISLRDPALDQDINAKIAAIFLELQKAKPHATTSEDCADLFVTRHPDIMKKIEGRAGRAFIVKRAADILKENDIVRAAIRAAGLDREPFLPGVIADAWEMVEPTITVPLEDGGGFAQVVRSTATVREFKLYFDFLDADAKARAFRRDAVGVLIRALPEDVDDEAVMLAELEKIKHAPLAAE